MKKKKAKRRGETNSVAIIHFVAAKTDLHIAARTTGVAVQELVLRITVAAHGSAHR